MATIHTASTAQGRDKAGVELATASDSNTVQLAMFNAGVVVCWDLAKVPDRRTLSGLLDRIKARLHEAAFPHA